MIQSAGIPRSKQSWDGIQVALHNTEKIQSSSEGSNPGYLAWTWENFLVLLSLVSFIFPWKNMLMIIPTLHDYVDSVRIFKNAQERVTVRRWWQQWQWGRGRCSLSTITIIRTIHSLVWCAASCLGVYFLSFSLKNTSSFWRISQRTDASRKSSQIHLV